MPTDKRGARGVLYMRIAVTHELYPPLVNGGGEFIVHRMANLLDSIGHEVYVITTNNRIFGSIRLERDKNVKVIRLPVKRYFMNVTSHVLVDLIKKINPDIIQTNNYNACLPSYLVAKKLNIPIFCLVHGVYRRKWLKMRGNIWGYLSWGIEKIQLSRDFNKFITLSNFAKNELVRLGISSERISVIPPGIDISEFKVDEKEDFVLFVGRIAWQKGIKVLLEVARRMPDYKFIVVGRKDDAYDYFIRHQSKNIEYLGYVSREKLLELYSKAKVFFLPSIAETFGYVILEAMASGCAIVSTVPLDYYGRYIANENIDEIVESIMYVWKNYKIGIRNRDKVKNYSWEKFVKQFIELYEKEVGC